MVGELEIKRNSHRKIFKACLAIFNIMQEEVH